MLIEIDKQSCYMAYTGALAEGKHAAEMAENFAWGAANGINDAALCAESVRQALFAFDAAETLAAAFYGH